MVRGNNCKIKRNLAKKNIDKKSHQNTKRDKDIRILLYSKLAKLFLENILKLKKKYCYGPCNIPIISASTQTTELLSCFRLIALNI